MNPKNCLEHVISIFYILSLCGHKASATTTGQNWLKFTTKTNTLINDIVRIVREVTWKTFKNEQPLFWPRVKTFLGLEIFLFKYDCGSLLGVFYLKVGV